MLRSINHPHRHNRSGATPAYIFERGDSHPGEELVSNFDAPRVEFAVAVAVAVAFTRV